MAKDGKSMVTPGLRFPEFREAEGWNVGSLAEVADFVNEKTPVSNVSTTDYVSTENLLSDYGGMTAASKLPTAGSVTRYQVNDVLISNIRPYLKKVWHADRNGGASNDVVVVRAKGVLSKAYLSLILKNDSFIAYVMRGAKGVKMPRGDVDSMREYPVAYPREREQQKIADCLTSLDEVIAAQGRKVEALKTHKRGLMQQLFPRDGETLPIFSAQSDWPTAELSEVAYFQEGPGILAVDFRSEGVPLVRLAGLNGLSVTLDGCNFLDPKRVLQKWDHFRLAAGDLLISTSASFGRPAIVTEATAGAVFYTGLIRFRPRDARLERGYLETFLGSPYFMRQAESAATGSGIKHFGPTHLQKMRIPIPPISEQKRISDCALSADICVAAESEKLTALMTHKKGLMQQLFPLLEGD